jgi:uncharacterized membrane-anchored protein
MKALSRRLAVRRRSGSAGLPGLAATARLDRRTKHMIRRLQPGDIAVIDHPDLDRVSAESLLNRQVAAVFNAAPSISGRYPNAGPQLLMEAGVPLVDDAGPEVFDRVTEGQRVRLDGDALYVDEAVVAKGTLQTAESVTAAMDRARDGLASQIRAFMANTVEYIGREADEIIDGLRVPELRTTLDGRHVLVVARGYRHREDLQTLRPYIREFKPALVAVDGGADTLLEAGYRPDLIVGDMDSVSDHALACGAELVVHAYPDGRAPGTARITELGLDAALLPGSGTSEDVALLLADELGARLIVAVGMRFSLAEFLDKGRPGMASAVLTRMRVGDKIVEPKGVSRLYQGRVSGRWLVLLVLSAVAAMLVAAAVLPPYRAAFSYLGVQFEALWRGLTGFF